MVSVAQLQDCQKATADARSALLQYVDEYVMKGKSVSLSISLLVRQARAGVLPAHLQKLIPIANARSNPERNSGLSESTVWSWWGKRKRGGWGSLVELIPQKSKQDSPTGRARFTKRLPAIYLRLRRDRSP